MAMLRHARLLLQLLLLAVAALVVAHGLFGPQIAPRNLASVLTWVHYRGLLIVGLLALGNVFCMGCPMMLVRDAGRRFVRPRLRWPRMLRTKWMAIVLLAAVLFAYELFDLWDLPGGTAWLVLVYFGAAAAVDLAFSGASFCKYVCPIGQFNFVASATSPTELRVRETATCRSCRTVDCIRGRRDPRAPARVVQRGCELALFQPVKIGNLDCTLCLDCVKACPHDNVVLAWRVPAEELLDTRRRSGIGVLARRHDLAALVLVFTFGALLNAFAMTAPARAVERWLAGSLHTTAEWPVLAALFAIALIAIPFAMVGTAAAATRAATHEREPVGGIAVRFAYALIPFGVGMWAAHYGFHLLTGFLTAVPVTQSAVIDATGRAILGEPLWRWAGMRPGSVFPVQLGFLMLGAIGSIMLAYQMARRDYVDRPVAAFIPWAAIITVMSVFATWLLAQPMDMRGTGFMG